MSETATNGQFVKVNDLDMYYEEYGTGDLVILIHAAFVASSSWESTIRVLSEHFRVIAPDSRAHGRTNNPAGKLSYAMMADDMAAFIEALNLDKPSVVGWSDGGQIGLEMGMRHPDLVKAIVVGGAWYKLSEPLLATMKMLGFEGIDAVNMKVFNQFLDQVGVRAYYEESHHHGPDYLKTLAMQLSTPFLTDLNYSTEDFQKIKAAALILVGDRDQIIPIEQAVDMYRQIPNAELSVSHHMDHSFPLARTEAFNSIILEFLLRHNRLVNTIGI